MSIADMMSDTNNDLKIKEFLNLSYNPEANYLGKGWGRVETSWLRIPNNTEFTALSNNSKLLIINNFPEELYRSILDDTDLDAAVEFCQKYKIRNDTDFLYSMFEFKKLCHDVLGYHTHYILVDCNTSEYALIYRGKNEGKRFYEDFLNYLMQYRIAIDSGTIGCKLLIWEDMETLQTAEASLMLKSDFSDEMKDTFNDVRKDGVIYI